MSYPSPTVSEVAEFMDVDFTSMGEGECTRLIGQARRFVQRRCNRRFEDETDQNVIDDIKELTCRVVERLFHQKPQRELKSQIYKGEKIGDYSYQKFDLGASGLTGDPDIDEMIAFYAIPRGVTIPAVVKLAGATRAATGSIIWLDYYKKDGRVG